MDIINNNGTFEQDMKQLEKIVAALEKGDMPLEQMLDTFEKGIALSKNCAAMLDKAEKRVKILTRKDDEVVEEDFAGVQQGTSR